MTNDSTALSLLLRRIAAFLYDCLLLIALFFVITLLVIALNDGQAVQHVLFYVGLYLFAFLFFDWFWRHGGQTLGMRAWRLRVEGMNTEKITFLQSAKRYFSGTVLFGVTLLFMFIPTRKIALHDAISETKIVIYFK